MNKIKLFIFDMDGLMFDTGRLAYRAYFEAAKLFDFEMNHQVYYYLTGRNEQDIRQKMGELYGEHVPYQEWRDKINEIKNQILDKEKRVYKKKGLNEILQFAKEQDILVALASSTGRKKIDQYLSMENLTNTFDEIISGESFLHSKPDPSIFLTTSHKLSIEPRNTMVFEDSIVGIKAANSANMYSILIEDDITDLPVRMGKYPLKSNIDTLNKDCSISADWHFESLLEARNFLCQSLQS